jgi:uncharacterized protein (DUF362 family)
MSDATLPADASLAPPDEAPKRRVSRRALLVGGAGVVAAAGVAGAVGVGWMRKGRSSHPLVTLPDHRVAKPATAPTMVVARGADAAKNVRAVLDRIGGLRQLVSKDDVVLVKPNIGWDRTPAQAANTNPEVVAAVVRACLEAGAREVLVTDASCHAPEPSFAKSGIAAAAREAGARVLLPSEVERRSITIPGKDGAWTILEPYARATKIINVPIAKHHGMAKLTAGLKSFFGLVEVGRKGLHVGLAESIVGLAKIARPTLTIVDATRVLMRNGPVGGNLADVKRLDAVAVSFDPVAVDAWAATELGFDVASIEHLGLAASAGLGTTDFRSLGLVEIST